MVSGMNADGTTGQSYSINVRDGKVFISKQLAGQDYILSVLTNASGWKFWDIGGDGAAVGVNSYNVAFNPIFPDIVVARNSNVTVQVGTNSGVGSNKMMEYESTKQQTVNIVFVTSEGKYSQGIKYRKVGGDGKWQWLPVTAGQSSVSFNADIGIYHMIPVWDPKDLTEPVDPWTPPSGGGGKG
jgi:hypothetical protein